MCCIFTCCGWVVDLIQRFWTFSMSCCISSAVCCALFTAAMAGIALGYNYSLAEYIDIKETNVSVYLKRGVFDDEIANEMEWRRSGNALPPPETKYRGGNFEITVPTPPSQDQMDFRRSMDTQDGRRRLDNSILESDDANKYEGSLMRLTAGVPVSISTITEEVSSADPKLIEIADAYTPDSLDQLKALQGIVNLRRGNVVPKTTPVTPKEPTINPIFFKHIPPGILNFLPDTMRRAMQYNDLGSLENNYHGVNVNPARKAVPMSMDDRDWRDPKLPKNYFTPDSMDAVDDHMTYPGPVNPSLRPARPTRPRVSPKHRDEPGREGEKPRERDDVLEKSIDSELGKFKEKLMMDKFDSLPDDEKSMKKSEDYDDDTRGLPVRRRRGELRRSRRMAHHFTPKFNQNDSIIIINDNYQSNLGPDLKSVGNSIYNLHLKTNNTVRQTLTTSTNIPAIHSNLIVFIKKIVKEVLTLQNTYNSTMLIEEDNLTSFSHNISTTNSSFVSLKNDSAVQKSLNDKVNTIEEADFYNIENIHTVSPVNNLKENSDYADSHYRTNRYIEEINIPYRYQLGNIVSFSVKSVNKNNNSHLDENELEKYNKETYLNQNNTQISVNDSNHHLICTDYNCSNYLVAFPVKFYRIDTMVTTDSYPSFQTENFDVVTLENVENFDVPCHLDETSPNDASVVGNDMLSTDVINGSYPMSDKYLESHSVTEENITNTENKHIIINDG